AGALVVVDQKRNIGALVLARAFAHGNPCAYLPGYAEKQARGMFPGVAKTDAIDAEVIARTARGMPGALRPLAEEPEGAASLRILSSQREFAAAARTRAKNRLRAALLEADPALERAVDPSRGWHVALLAEFGSAAGCSAAGWRRFSAAAKRAGASVAGARALWEAMLITLM
ncbi:MAG: transposase, partial [Collinsella stercoris]|nr:transposase [Collinsella stercoris]